MKLSIANYLPWHLIETGHLGTMGGGGMFFLNISLKLYEFFVKHTLFSFLT